MDKAFMKRGHTASVEKYRTCATFS